MAWKMLFGSDVGLFSLLTILGVIGIGVAMYLFFRKKMNEVEAEQEHGESGN